MILIYMVLQFSIVVMSYTSGNASRERCVYILQYCVCNIVPVVVRTQRP